MRTHICMFTHARMPINPGNVICEHNLFRSWYNFHLWSIYVAILYQWEDFIMSWGLFLLSVLQKTEATRLVFTISVGERDFSVFLFVFFHQCGVRCRRSCHDLILCWICMSTLSLKTSIVITSSESASVYICLSLCWICMSTLPLKTSTVITSSESASVYICWSLCWVYTSTLPDDIYRDHVSSFLC